MINDNPNTSNLLLVEIDPYRSSMAGLEPERVDFQAGQVLLKAGQIAEKILFPQSGLLSCFKVVGQTQTEVLQVGFEGAIGLHSALMQNDNSETLTSVAQSDGSAVGLPTGLVRSMALEHQVVNDAFHQYLRLREVETAEVLWRSATCSITVRLAHWILRADQRLKGEPIIITHEILSDILYSRRPSITTALHDLEAIGAVKSLRKRIQVRNRAALREAAYLDPNGNSSFPPSDNN